MRSVDHRAVAEVDADVAEPGEEEQVETDGAARAAALIAELL
jgi:hypothetical protein